MDIKPGGARQTPQKGAEAKGGAESPQVTGGARQTPQKGAKAKGGAGSPQVTGGAQRMPKKRSQGRAESPEVAPSPDSDAAEDEMGDGKTRHAVRSSDTDGIRSLRAMITNLEQRVADEAQTSRSMTERMDASITELRKLLHDVIFSLKLPVAAQSETLKSIASDDSETSSLSEAIPTTPLTSPLPAPDAEEHQGAQAAEAPAASPSVSTAKHESFVKESMKNKKVNEMPGISGATAKQLKLNGFEYAYQVLGHYLESGMCQKTFKKWLKDEIDAGTRAQNACFEAVEEWCEYHHFP